MPEADGQQVESIAACQLVQPSDTLSLQNDSRHLSQVGWAIVCPLKYLACAMTATLQVFEPFDIELFIDQSAGR